MPLSTNKFIGGVLAIVLFTVVSNIYYPNVFMFLAFMFIGLATKYHKAVYSVSFLITDMTDFFVVLTYYKLGLSSALLMAFIFGYTYLVIGMAGNEGPTDASARFIGISICALLLPWLTSAYPPMTVLILIVTLSGFIWGTLQITLFHIANPVYFPIALCRGVLYYKFLPYLMPILGLG
ncbi:hypothetical protein ACFLQI_02860 [Candidatus Undinarchaeota archaeon]